MSDYSLIDSGLRRKLERFGNVLLDRPSPQAVWQPDLPPAVWEEALGFFTREMDGSWRFKPKMPEEWVVELEGIRFKLAPTDFGHLGIFPEQRASWRWIRQKVKKGAKVLNLFAYSGGATLAAALGGAEVCHLDASKKMVAWAKENAQLTGLEKAPIRWIVDDVQKFLKRELRRSQRYDAIILDPPSFGRGPKGELFKIEEALPEILSDVKALLSDKPLFILFSCHSPGFSPIVCHNLLSQLMGNGQVEVGEMLLEGEGRPLPSGVFARWSLGDH